MDETGPGIEISAQKALEILTNQEQGGEEVEIAGVVREEDNGEFLKQLLQLLGIGGEDA